MTDVGTIGFDLAKRFPCELPIVLALIGLGSLSTAAMALKPPVLIEVAGIVLVVIGAVLLIALAIRRVWFQKRSAES